jgi:ABC-2 type transport system permease protein
MELAILGQAFREYLRFRRVVAWIVFALICGGLAYAWRFFIAEPDAAEQYANVSSMLVFRLVALASAIFTTAIISQEVEQRTIVYLLTRPVARWKLLLIRFLASATVVSVLGVMAAVCTSYGAYGKLGGNPLLSGDISAIVAGAFAYGSLFLFISLLFNRSMLFCLLFAFGWETAIPNMPGGMQNLSILTYLQAIAQHPTNDQSNSKMVQLLAGMGSVNLTTPDRAWAVLIGLIVVCVFASAWWFTHFEFVPREDAE